MEIHLFCDHTSKTHSEKYTICDCLISNTVTMVFPSVVSYKNDRTIIGSHLWSYNIILTI